MKTRMLRKGLFSRLLCILLCIILFTESVPISSAAQAAGSGAQKKFIKVESEVFAPSAKEKTTISFNLEGKKKAVRIYVKDGKKIVANLVTNKEYEGNYAVHQFQWDGKDEQGKYVKSGMYKIVVEPLGKYSKFKSIANVCVVGDSTKSLYIAPNRTGSVFPVYGSGGKKQGVKKVTLSVKKDGKAVDSIPAVVGENLWYAKLPMSSYEVYELAAKVESSSGTQTSRLSAVVHTFRVTDRLSYLASAYYGDSSKVTQLQEDNDLEDGSANSGAWVGTNLLVINPNSSIRQEVKANNTQVNQHLGIIDQLQRITSQNPMSLSMGNQLYVSEDLVIEGAVPLILNRSYNSMSQSFHELGINWTQSYTYFLQDMGNTTAIRFGDGHIEYYRKQTDGSYDKPEGMARTLTANADGTYTLLVDRMHWYLFAKDGTIQSITDRNGNATTFSYTGEFLSKVENNSGFFEFSYNKEGRIESVQDHTNRRISYAYTDGLLTGFTDVEGNQTTYCYDSKNRLNKVITPEGVILLTVAYDSSDRVLERSVRGSKYTYHYEDKERSITCTEPNGTKTTFRYTKEYRIASEESSDGTIKYSYQNNTNAAQSKATQSKSVQSKSIQNKEQKSQEEQTKEEQIKKAQTKEVQTKKEQSQEAKSKKVISKGTTSKEENTTENTKVKTISAKENAANLLELKTLNMSVCTGEQKFNTIYPQYQIINTSGEDLSLSEVTLRYYYTIDEEKPQNFFCDWSNIGAANVTGKFVKLANPVPGADYYAEVGFTSGAGTLLKDSAVDLHTRITKADWVDFVPGDDYSQNTSGTLCYFDQVDVFYKGTLVWGKGSIKMETQTMVLRMMRTTMRTTKKRITKRMTTKKRTRRKNLHPAEPIV